MCAIGNDKTLALGTRAGVTLGGSLLTGSSAPGARMANMAPRSSLLTGGGGLTRSPSPGGAGPGGGRGGQAPGALAY
jgi:hypothetical protein